MLIGSSIFIFISIGTALGLYFMDTISIVGFISLMGRIQALKGFIEAIPDDKLVRYPDSERPLWKTRDFHLDHQGVRLFNLPFSFPLAQCIRVP